MWQRKWESDKEEHRGESQKERGRSELRCTEMKRKVKTNENGSLNFSVSSDNHSDLCCGWLRTADRKHTFCGGVCVTCLRPWLEGRTRPLCPYWLQCHVTAVIINVSWCQRVSWWPTSQQSTLTLWLPPKPDLARSLFISRSLPQSLSLTLSLSASPYLEARTPAWPSPLHFLHEH